jgi:gamma-glutamyl-gamma-aminobutyrate hydrolase PuuD
MSYTIQRLPEKIVAQIGVQCHIKQCKAIPAAQTVEVWCHGILQKSMISSSIWFMQDMKLRHITSRCCSSSVSDTHMQTLHGVSEQILMNATANDSLFPTD